MTEKNVKIYTSINTYTLKLKIVEARFLNILLESGSFLEKLLRKTYFS